MAPYLAPHSLDVDVLEETSDEEDLRDHRESDATTVGLPVALLDRLPYLMMIVQLVNAHFLEVRSHEIPSVASERAALIHHPVPNHVNPV